MLDAAAPTCVVVNGPEGDIPDWDAVRWRVVEEGVRRLRQRIFTATQAGDWKKVRNLQKLMLRSRANALMSVRRVTEVNAGRHPLPAPSPRRHRQWASTPAVLTERPQGLA
jgi:RNA-directed DNA polymerase